MGAAALIIRPERERGPHGRIYTQNTHYKLSHELDNALSALLDDLAAPKSPNGSSLLDETMVVCMGEFGRTPGDLNLQRGRDHRLLGAGDRLEKGGAEHALGADVLLHRAVRGEIHDRGAGDYSAVRVKF